MTETALAMPGGWISRSPDVRPRDALRATFTWIVVIWRDHGRVLAAASSIWNAVPEHRDQWEALQSRLITAFNRQIDLERRAGQPLAVPGLDSVALSTLLMWMAERVVSILQAGTATDLSYDDLIEALTSVWVRSVYLHDRPDP